MSKDLWHWQTEELFRQLYQPLQYWLAQHGTQYPWSMRLEHSSNTNYNSTHVQSRRNNDCSIDSIMLPNSYAVWGFGSNATTN